MKKIINKIIDYLPVSRGEMKKVISKMVLLMDGYTTAAITQQQTTTGILKALEKMKTTDDSTGDTKKKNDPAYN